MSSGLPSPWTIVGGGLTGASLAYELAKRGQPVCLIEQHSPLQGATRWSYGGIAYWSGTTPLMRQLCQESHDRYRGWQEELPLGFEYRETQLLIPILATEDFGRIYAQYQDFTPAADVLSPAAAQDLEPLLRIDRLQAVLRFPHAHVQPQALAAALLAGLEALGGTVIHTTVHHLLTQPHQITGIQTDNGALPSDRLILCAGAGGRSLLNPLGLSVPLYFNQAELIETEPTDLRLQSVVLPAHQSRLNLEAQFRDPALAAAWEADHRQGLAREHLPPVVEPGGVQFQDGRCRLGQISRLCSRLDQPVDPAASEAQIRGTIADFLPDLAALPGTWRRCAVSFSADGLPLIGTLTPWQNLHLFSGFNSPFALVPALAARFAQALTKEMGYSPLGRLLIE